MMKISRLKLINHDDWLIDACRNKQALHIGCIDYPMKQSRINENRLLHEGLCEIAREVVDLNIDKEGVEQILKLSMKGYAVKSIVAPKFTALYYQGDMALLSSTAHICATFTNLWRLQFFYYLFWPLRG